ncbi:MAG: AMP-binding protein [Chloroflexi bacterium]|nr:AMP-binding protein [Chloroflexota bacterium]
MPEPTPTYETLRSEFSWSLPRSWNIGVACSDQQPASSLALIEVSEDGARRDYTFGDLTELSNRLANALRGRGVMRGDRVAVMLSQRVELGLAHLALYKIGAIVLPLSGLFGPNAIRHRLESGDASMLITEPQHLESVSTAVDQGDLEIVLVEPGPVEHVEFWDLLRSGSDAAPDGPSDPSDPALLIYTSGTTGPSKGALHAHRALLGHLPGFDLSHDFFPKDGDLFWTPADWAWIGGLMDALLPSWYHGKPIVAAARGSRFDPEWAVDLMSSLGVRNVFLPPTALKLLRRQAVDASAVDLRSVMSGGEPLDAEILAWGRENLGITINEMYGQTEANYVVGNCASAWEVRPGSMGRPYPGHDVSVLDAEGLPLPVGEVGELAVRASDPVLFLRYWEDPDATKKKFTASRDWLLTGDLAYRDSDGYLWFKSRSDDVINSAGYRIGPAEVESCLLEHPAIAMAAAIGVPDEVRGQVVKAYVVLTDDADGTDGLMDDLKKTVRTRLAAYVYPREIEVVPELPLTPTGKVLRSELRRADADMRSQATLQGESN